jgi:ABC-2 type transport system permease protein
MTAVTAIIGLTLREASRRRLLLAAVVLGGAFLGLYAFGMTLVLGRAPCAPPRRPCPTPFEAAQFAIGVNMLSLAGLYVANFLSVMAAVLLPIDTLSGEIDSGIAQTLASKPIRRAEILLAKWLAHWILITGYVLLAAGGVMATAWLVTRTLTGGRGFIVPNSALGLALIALEATVMLTISIAGGTRLKTITNGMVAFGIFGLSFLGGWMEQIGELFVQADLARVAIRDIGTVVSLAIPTDAIWRLAASQMMPAYVRELGLTPFAPMFPPTSAMAIWGAVYAAGVLALAFRQFHSRAL